MSEKKYEFIFDLMARAVFRKDGSLTWFGWICLLAAGVFCAAIISLFQGCVNCYTRFPTTDARIERVYQSSGTAAGMSIIVMFPQLMSDSPSGRFFRIENLISIPIGCVGMCDAACEAVVDTVLLPFDWPISSYRKKNEE